MTWIIILKPFFKLNSFLRAIFSSLERSYDKLRIKETCISHGELLSVKKGKSFVTKHTTLGNNIHFNGMKIYGSGEVSIGDNFHCGKDCSIITDNHNYDNGFAIPYDSTYIIKNVIIEDNVWLGEGVMILGGSVIGEGAIIQARSVVTGSIPKHAIAGGHPAKVFSKRNLDHYEQLKLAGKFY